MTPLKDLLKYPKAREAALSVMAGSVILQCPFCGGEPCAMLEDGGSPFGYFEFGCQNEGCACNPSCYVKMWENRPLEEQMREVVERWNTRVTDTPNKVDNQSGKL